MRLAEFTNAEEQLGLLKELLTALGLRLQTKLKSRSDSGNRLKQKQQANPAVNVLPSQVAHRLHHSSLKLLQTNKVLQKVQ